MEPHECRHVEFRAEEERDKGEDASGDVDREEDEGDADDFFELVYLVVLWSSQNKRGIRRQEAMLTAQLPRA